MFRRKTAKELLDILNEVYSLATDAKTKSMVKTAKSALLVFLREKALNEIGCKVFDGEIVGLADCLHKAEVIFSSVRFDSTAAYNLSVCSYSPASCNHGNAHILLEKAAALGSIDAKIDLLIPLIYGGDYAQMSNLYKIIHSSSSYHVHNQYIDILSNFPETHKYLPLFVRKNIIKYIAKLKSVLPKCSNSFYKDYLSGLDELKSGLKPSIFLGLMSKKLPADMKSAIYDNLLLYYYNLELYDECISFSELYKYPDNVSVLAECRFRLYLQDKLKFDEVKNCEIPDGIVKEVLQKLADGTEVEKRTALEYISLKYVGWNDKVMINVATILCYNIATKLNDIDAYELILKLLLKSEHALKMLSLSRLVFVIDKVKWTQKYLNLLVYGIESGVYNPKFSDYTYLCAVAITYKFDDIRNKLFNMFISDKTALTKEQIDILYYDAVMQLQKGKTFFIEVLELLFKLGCDKAANALYLIYFNGMFSIPVDKKKALTYFDDMCSIYDKISMSIAPSPTEMSLLKAEYVKHSPFAAFTLGNCHYLGLGVQTDYALAATYWESCVLLKNDVSKLAMENLKSTDVLDFVSVDTEVTSFKCYRYNKDCIKSCSILHIAVGIHCTNEQCSYCTQNIPCL